MAVTKVNTYLYIGLAGDTKPTSPPHESKYLASDTGAVSIFIQGTGWVALTGVTVSIPL